MPESSFSVRRNTSYTTRPQTLVAITLHPVHLRLFQSFSNLLSNSRSSSFLPYSLLSRISFLAPRHKLRSKSPVGLGRNDSTHLLYGSKGRRGRHQRKEIEVPALHLYQLRALLRQHLGEALVAQRPPRQGSANRQRLGQVLGRRQQQQGGRGAAGRRALKKIPYAA